MYNYGDLFGEQEEIIIKIHINGGSGSGKSYISALLSEKFNIPHYDLDDIFGTLKQMFMPFNAISYGDISNNNSCFVTYDPE